MRSRVPYALVALALMPWSYGAAQEAEEPAVTDPTGDATWMTSSDLVGTGGQACGLAGQASHQACSNAPVGALPDAGGLPAPPALDIVHARLEADGETLRVELAVGSLDATFPAAGVDDEFLFYSVCWSVGDEVCAESVGAGVYRAGGTMQLDSYAFSMRGLCAKVGGCWFSVPLEVVAGTPGYLRWEAPRSLLEDDNLLLGQPLAYTVHALMPPAPAAPGFAYHARAQDAQVGGAASGYAFSSTDEAGPGRDVVLPPASRAFTPQRDSQLTLHDQTGDVPVAEREDLDILNASFLEDEKSLTISLQLGRVDDEPLSHHLYMTLGPTTGASIIVGYTAEDGARSTYSGVCGDICEPHPRTPLRKPADFTFVSGTPGWINVTIGRADLGNPGEGDTLAYFYAGMLLPDAIVQQEAGDAGAEGVHYWYGDLVWEVPPWWFQLGKARAINEDDTAFYLEDEIGDVNPQNDPSLSALALTSSFAAFDISSLKVDGLSPTELRIELGVSDLSSIAPPSGFTAVFYAAAISTEQGSFMVGYYDDRAQKDFFCAPDTAVLATPESDPHDVIWQPIQGLLSVARDRGAGAAGGSTPGAIVFLAPYSCFAWEPGTDLTAETIAAATFLLRQAEQEVTMQRVDDAVSGDSSPIVIPAVAASVTAWYVAPLGISNFWDITGIVFAAIVALVGAVAIRRKRGGLRRYLHEIDRALIEHAHNARDREKALVGIRVRVREDLLKNRVTENHFVIVERRLDEQLSKVRVQALGDAFGDLPHRLLLTLQHLLRDGVMDPEDWKLFRSQLAGEAHLTGDSRTAIERRVEAWVRQEQALASG